MWMNSIAVTEAELAVYEVDTRIARISEIPLIILWPSCHWKFSKILNYNKWNLARLKETKKSIRRDSTDFHCHFTSQRLSTEKPVNFLTMLGLQACKLKFTS